jgi:hypothetical protein
MFPRYDTIEPPFRVRRTSWRHSIGAQPSDEALSSVAQDATSTDAAERVAKKGVPCSRKSPVTDVARARKFYEETLGLKSGSSGNQVRLRGQSGRAADIMQ